MRVIQALRVRVCNPAGAGVVVMAKSDWRASQGVSTKGARLPEGHSAQEAERLVGSGGCEAGPEVGMP